MTVSTTTSRVEYAGNGSTTAFSVPFYFLANGDLKVYQDGVLKTITTDYTVTGAGVPAGGTVTFLTAPATGEDVVIFRDPAITQATDYSPNDPFPAESHEMALDKLTMVAQRLSDRLGRAFVLPDADTSGASTTLPTPAATELIGWDADGTALTNYSAAALAGSIVATDWITETFDGDGTTSVFSLSRNPGVASNCDVSISGVTQTPGIDYDVTTDTISFASAPSVGTDNVVVRYGPALSAVSPVGTNGVATAAIQDGAVTAIKLADDAVETRALSDGVAESIGFQLIGGFLSWSVAGNDLTVSIKTSSVSDPSASDPVKVVFRNQTPGSAAIFAVDVTSATSITVPNTALMGTSNSTPFRLWCVAFYSGGTVRLGLINCLSGTSIFPLRGWGITGTTTVVSTSADNAHTFYAASSTGAAASYSVLGWASWESGLATAGTWSSAPTRVQMHEGGEPLPGDVIQRQRTVTGAHATGTTNMPFDDTIPQITEGDQFLSQSITPRSAANLLDTEVKAYMVLDDAAAILVHALFVGATADALSAGAQYNGTVTATPQIVHQRNVRLAGSTSSVTMRFRAGRSGGAGTVSINGATAGRLLGGVMNSYIDVAEVMA